MRIVAAVIAVSLTSGCAFLVTEREAVQPVDKHYLSSRRATFDCSAGLTNVATPVPTAKPISKQQMRHAWGEPDEIQVGTNTERWLYKKDRLWTGIWGAVVVIPIPLLVPTGRERMAIDFEGDQVSSVKVFYQHGSGGGCSLIPIPAGDGIFFGCDSVEATADAELTPFCVYGERLNK